MRTADGPSRPESTFRRARPGESLQDAPHRIRADLQVSQDLLSQAHTLEAMGLSGAAMKQLVEEEQSRHQRLADQLEPYVAAEGDEP